MVTSSQAVQAQQRAGIVEGSYVEVFGQRIRYVEKGQGPPVLLLHALGADLSDWSLNLDALARGHRVIAFDSVGSGFSDKPGIDYRPSTMIDFLGGLMTALNVERASLVGHSFSGATAAGFALAHPERVNRLVIVAAGYGLALPEAEDPAQLGFVPGTLRYIFPGNLAETRQLVRIAFADQRKADDPKIVEEAFTQANRAGHLMNRIRASFVSRAETLDGKLSNITRPTLVIWGRKDGVNPFAMGERYQREIPGSRLLAFDGSSHFPNQEEAPAFNDAVLRFLAGEQVGTSVPTPYDLEPR